MDMSRRTVLQGTAVAALSTLAPRIAPRPPARQPRDVTFPVTLGSTDAMITGRLHQPAGRPRGMIVCIPGMTYNASYWDFPHRGNNFAAAMTAAGWMVLTLNLPGTDPSAGYPPPGVLTIANEAAAVHQVVTRTAVWARRVILAGHSVGSSIALEAAGLGGVDALMLTAFIHNPSTAGRALAQQVVVPAPGLPTGYITTAADQRWKAFLQTDTDPAVVALDEKLKATGSVTELATLPGSFDPAVSRALSMPVLIVNGTADILDYGPNTLGTTEFTVAHEAPYWTRPPDIWMLPRAPHDINLARNAGAWFSTAARFADLVAR